MKVCTPLFYVHSCMTWLLKKYIWQFVRHFFVENLHFQCIEMETWIILEMHTCLRKYITLWVAFLNGILCCSVATRANFDLDASEENLQWSSLLFKVSKLKGNRQSSGRLGTSSALSQAERSLRILYTYRSYYELSTEYLLNIRTQTHQEQCPRQGQSLDHRHTNLRFLQPP